MSFHVHFATAACILPAIPYYILRTRSSSYGRLTLTCGVKRCLLPLLQAVALPSPYHPCHTATFTTFPAYALFTIYCICWTAWLPSALTLQHAIPYNVPFACKRFYHPALFCIAHVPVPRCHLLPATCALPYTCHDAEPAFGHGWPAKLGDAFSRPSSTITCRVEGTGHGGGDLISSSHFL